MTDGRLDRDTLEALVRADEKGRYTLRVRAVDKAGNVTAKKKVLRIP